MHRLLSIRGASAAAALWALLCAFSVALVNDVGGSRFVEKAERTAGLRRQLDAALWESHPRALDGVAAAGGQLALPGTDKANVSWLMREVPVDRAGTLRVTARLRGLGLPSDEESRRGARFVILAKGVTGELMYGQKHVLGCLHGTTDWELHRATFKVPENAVAVRLGLMNFGGRGRAEAKDVGAAWVEPRPLARAGLGGAVLAWLILGLFALRHTLGILKGRWAKGLTFCAVAALLGFALVPRGTVERPVKELAAAGLQTVSGAIGDAPLLASVPAAPEPLAAKPGRPKEQAAAASSWSPWDAAHFVGFTVLSLLLAFGSRCGGPATLARALSLGVSIEVLQLFTPDRTASVSDVIVDLLGILFGLAVFRVMHHRAR